MWGNFNWGKFKWGKSISLKYSTNRGSKSFIDKII